MDDKSKRELKRALGKAEESITRSIIRWKYRKEGKPLPDEDHLKDHSQEVVDQAHRVIAKRGKVIWKELKKVYSSNVEKKRG